MSDRPDYKVTDVDYSEKERVVHLEVEIPLYGNDLHVDALRDRVRRDIALRFPGATVTDVDSVAVEE